MFLQKNLATAVSRVS
jgi:hypothetical protein